MRTIKKYLTVMLAITLFGLVGCNSVKTKPVVQPPPVIPPQELNETARENNPGSLFAESEVDTLFSDSRARRIGDIVVVRIVESTQASNTADTTTNKTGSNTYGVGAAFGASSIGMYPQFSQTPLGSGRQAPVGEGRLALGTNSGSAYNSTGETTRENTVISSLAARVIKILPGSNLQIEGARAIRVNDETQYMVVTGIIRAKDVANDNSIMSTQIADASIQYYGQGVLADKQKPGWFSRMMDNVWPF